MVGKNLFFEIRKINSFPPMNLKIFWVPPNFDKVKMLRSCSNLVCLFLTTFPRWVISPNFEFRKKIYSLPMNLEIFWGYPEFWQSKNAPILFKLGMLFSKKATISPIKKPSAWRKARPSSTLHASKEVISSKELSPLWTLNASKVAISNCSVAPQSSNSLSQQPSKRGGWVHAIISSLLVFYCVLTQHKK